MIWKLFIYKLRIICYNEWYYSKSWEELQLPNYDYTYNDLKEKYKNFSVPNVCININGKKVATLLADDNKKDTALNVSSVVVRLSLDRSSIAEIDVADIYSYSNSSITKVATIGSKIEVYMGYGNDKTVTRVFCGYIAKIDYELSGIFKATITALDVLNLMEQEYCPKYYISKSYDDIVKEVLGKYSALIEESSCDALGVTKEYVYREEKVSDLRFIRRLCSEVGKQFYVSNGTAYINSAFSGKSTINLDIHEVIQYFRISNIYQNSKVKVIGFNPEDHNNSISEECVAKTKGCKTITNAPQTKVVTMSNMDTPTKAKQYAESLAKNVLKDTQKCNIVTIGLPEITVGKTITISNVDKLEFDKYKYNVTEVIHTMDINGFSTNINICGWS